MINKLDTGAEANLLPTAVFAGLNPNVHEELEYTNLQLKVFKRGIQCLW